MWGLILFLLGVLLCVLAYFAFRPLGGYTKWQQKSGGLKIITEDILKEVYSSPQQEVSFECLQERMALSEKMLRKALLKMQHQGWLRQEQQQIKLTATGKQSALEIIRAHRLYEHFLAEKTGYAPIQWHKQAEKMEHHLNEKQLSEIIRQVGNPRYDPHGDPIPTEVGKLYIPSGEKLSRLEKGICGRIIHIEDEPTAIYRQILDKDIHVGSIIRVLDANTHSITFYSEGEQFVLKAEVAQNITVHIFDKESKLEHTQGVRLSGLKLGEKGRILSISAECRGANRRRLLDLGFVKGSQVVVQMSSPLENPKAYLIRNTLIALRDDQAKHILIEKIDT